jgi:hypothetical protein
MNMDSFLLIENFPEGAFHNSENMKLFRVIHRLFEKILQLPYSLELGYFAVPMKIHPVSEKRLSVRLDNPAGELTIIGIL